MDEANNFVAAEVVVVEVVTLEDHLAASVVHLDIPALDYADDVEVDPLDFLGD